MFKLFEPFPQIYYGLSKKQDGPIELADNLSAVNRVKFFEKSGVKPSNAVTPLQSHSTEAVKVSNISKVSADSVVTTIAGLTLTVTVADCFPIYFFDPAKNIIALAHSGWRGTVGNIAAKTIKLMGSNPKSILVGIGPGIQACHFEIKEDVLNQFTNYKSAIARQGSKIFADLPKIITAQLTQSGVPEHNIESSGECTYENPREYFSYRRDRPKEVKAMVAYIGVY